MAQWSQWLEFDRKLITLVEKHSLIYLWRRCEKQNLLTNIRQCWDNIAAAMGSNPIFCKSRWKTVRDKYIKNKKKGDKKTIKGALSFIDHARENVETISSTCPECKKQAKEVNIINENTISLPVTIEEAPKKIKKKVNKQSKARISSNEGLANTSSTINVNNLVTYENTIRLISKEEALLANQAEVFEEKRDTVAEELLKNINPDVKQIIIDHFEKSIHNNVSDINETTAMEQDDSEDDILCETLPNHDEGSTETFFRRMGEYVVNQFPYEKQLEIRLKICSLVTNTELEMLQEAMK